MPTSTTGQWLNQFVAPQLLAERRNYKADFMGVLGAVPQSARNADGVRYNKLINNVEFKVNNTSEFTPKKMTGEKVFLEWEKYDTTPTMVDDAEIRYLAYDKRNAVRVKHNECFQIGIRNHTLHKLAPANGASSDMPVMLTTGAIVDGRRRLTYVDLATYLETVKKLNLPQSDQLYMILCPQHVTDLLLDIDAAKYFINRELYIDPIKGTVKNFMGFKFFENNDAVYYDPTTKTKVAEGTAPTQGTHFQASQFFYAPNTIYHLDRVKILYKPETLDTRNADPTSEFRTQTYGMVDRIEEYGVGALISAKATE